MMYDAGDIIKIDIEAQHEWTGDNLVIICKYVELYFGANERDTDARCFVKLLNLQTGLHRQRSLRWVRLEGAVLDTRRQDRVT